MKGGHQRHLITGQLAISRGTRYTNICNQCGTRAYPWLSFVPKALILSLCVSSQALFHHYATCEEHSSLLSVVGGVGYNSTGLVEGLAHQTHLQHVNDDGKEVICVHGHLWSWHLGQLTNGNQHTGQHRPVPT